jgi:hypothetical protein
MAYYAMRKQFSILDMNPLPPFFLAIVLFSTGLAFALLICELAGFQMVLAPF